MATDSEKNPFEEGPAAADGKKKRKQQSDRKYREKLKKKQESNEAQLKTLENKCSRYKAQLEFYETMVKPLLDGACETRKLVLEPGESSGHAREAVEKQTDLVNSLSWELLTPPPGGGTCGGTSASTDKDACPPLELSVAAMKPDGSVTTESFKPCQLLPEQWTPLKHSTCRKECRGSTSYSTEVLEGVPNPMESAMSLNGSVMSGSFKPCESLPDADKLTFNELKELYIASVAQHAQEKDTLLKLHAQEKAATAARHAQEMAAAKDRHAKEMAAVKKEYSLELENMGQPLAEAFSNFDTNQLLDLDEILGCSSAEMKNIVWTP